MTSMTDPPEQDSLFSEPEEEDTQVLPRPDREPRPRRGRPQPNPALDPRLAQLERRRRPSRASDVSLLIIGVAAFVFGVAMHYYVATSVLEGGEASDSGGATVEATVTPTIGPLTPTATVGPAATATPLPDRTNCDEIRGTQYRSVTEREFFLANCTTG